MIHIYYGEVVIATLCYFSILIPNDVREDWNSLGRSQEISREDATNYHVS